MFHAWPVKIMITDASSRPTLLVGNAATSARTRPGMNPSTGMLWRMSSAGMRTFSAVRSRAAQYPYPSVKASESTYAARPRERERKA